MPGVSASVRLEGGGGLLSVYAFLRPVCPSCVWGKWGEGECVGVLSVCALRF